MSDQLREAESLPAPVCRKWGSGAVLREVLRGGEVLGNRGYGNHWWHMNHLLANSDLAEWDALWKYNEKMLSCLGVLHSVA